MLSERRKAIYPLAGNEVGDIKIRMQDWANRSGILIFLDNNHYAAAYNGYECLLATGVHHTVPAGHDALAAVQQWHNAHADWLFGHISYDYKHVPEPGLQPAAPATVHFPLTHFFCPVTVCSINRACTTLTIESYEDPAAIYAAIVAATLPVQPLPALAFAGGPTQQQYIATVQQLRHHIAQGDCYEINYCTERRCDNAVVDPRLVFRRLNEVSPSPYAAWYRLQHLHLMCASPERYIKKHGDTIISQPIKGTARRGTNVAADEAQKQQLRHSIKEQAENVMITDLVRNDLARTCRVGSITVDELFGIYTFPQVHQMVSTVSGLLRSDVSFMDAVRCSFPMGSMTGAPKYKVMQLIEQYETGSRGLFSGTVGYITPAGDFDFNVIIRSLFYDEQTQILTYQTGGAITWDSEPEEEWAEMRLKAAALEKIFGG